MTFHLQVIEPATWRIEALILMGYIVLILIDLHGLDFQKHKTLCQPNSVLVNAIRVFLPVIPLLISIVLPAVISLGCQFGFLPVTQMPAIFAYRLDLP